MYVDYKYYVSEYLLGKVPAISETEFPYWEKQARTEIDRYTFGRMRASSFVLTAPVKDCCCELAELLYMAEQVTQQSGQNGASGPLSAFSNDGQSGTFDLSQSIYTESGKQKKMREIIYRHLLKTGLLYAGCAERRS